MTLAPSAEQHCCVAMYWSLTASC